MNSNSGIVLIPRKQNTTANTLIVGSENGNPYVVDRKTMKTVSPLSSFAVLSGHGHQDRRFTGCKGELRCLATTTRGKACSYVCVNRTKYCYLHADYDFNPPPRRWTMNSKNQTCSVNDTKTVGESVGVRAATEGGEKPSDKFSGIPVVWNSSPTTMASDESLRIRSSLHQDSDSGRGSKCHGSRESSPKNADSPLPLLSMVSTDFWCHKSVRIASGHLTGKVGTVEKWANGWVTVYVPGVGMHNRRAFELHLHSHVDGIASSQHVHPIPTEKETTFSGITSSREKECDIVRPKSQSSYSKVLKGRRSKSRKRKRGLTMSPLTVRASAELSEAARVTPLASREAHHILFQ